MTQGLSVAHAARRIAGDHEKVRRLLGLVEAAFGRSRPLAGSGPDMVAARLDTLRGPLRAHFEEEEGAALFERIDPLAADCDPSIRSLRREHQALLEHLDSLRSAPPLDRRNPRWLREVRRFLEDLAGHEEQERVLLRSEDSGLVP
jgi:hypothetical protein